MMTRTWTFFTVVALVVAWVEAASLTKTEETVEARLAALEQRQRECTADIRALQQILMMRDSNTQVQADEELDEADRVKRQDTNPKIYTGPAFSVYLDELPAAAGPGEIIIYNKAVTNEGNGYNTGTGIFAVSQPGLYLFSYTVCQLNMDTVWADLYVNGKARTVAIAEPQHADQDMQGTNTIVVRLNGGDMVWIAVQNGQENTICHMSAMFTGVFLRP